MQLGYFQKDALSETQSSGIAGFYLGAMDSES